MGGLHPGHQYLIKKAKESKTKLNQIILVSIFVNPLQFSKGEDFKKYPRNINRDAELAFSAGADAIWVPDYFEVFPGGEDSHFKIQVPKTLHNQLCGVERAGHFDGVATVVCKLFNIINPNKAFFGLKDYQQFLIIQKLVADLAFETELIGVETVREENGLALSSRNSYLSKQELEHAATIFENLNEAAIKIQQGQKDFQDLEQQAIISITEAGLQSDYFSICHAQTLEPAKISDSDIVILAAAYLGTTRLIDNIRISI